MNIELYDQNPEGANVRLVGEDVTIANTIVLPRPNAYDSLVPVEEQ